VRIRLAVNAAGDMRLTALSDKPRMQQASEPQGSALVCSDELQEMTTPPGAKTKTGFGALARRGKITRYGSRLLREAGAVLDECGRERTVFLTGTLPGGSPASIRALAEWSGWAVQTITQWLRDFDEHPQFIGVWEYQKRGALHMHLCVRCQSTAVAREIRARFKERWIRVIDAIGRRSGVDMYERKTGGTWRDEKWRTRTDAQVVEKSVGTYLSKYLSKGAKETQASCALPPSAWWFCSRAVRREVQSRRQQVEITDLSKADAAEIFQKLGATIVSQERPCFAWDSPVRADEHGITALLKPIEAWLVFSDLLREINLWRRILGQTTVIRRATIYDAACIFRACRVA
jgi:hypothetical protein